MKNWRVNLSVTYFAERVVAAETKEQAMEIAQNETVEECPDAEEVQAHAAFPQTQEDA